MRYNRRIKSFNSISAMRLGVSHTCARRKPSLILAKKNRLHTMIVDDTGVPTRKNTPARVTSAPACTSAAVSASKALKYLCTSVSAGLL